MTLTISELQKISNWQPYRPDWVVNRNLSSSKDNIDIRYGDLIKELTRGSNFDCHLEHDGGMTNYLEFWLFQPDKDDQKDILRVFISLCAPVGTYIETKAIISKDLCAADNLEISKVNRATKLLNIEKELGKILERHNVSLLESEFLKSEVPKKIPLNSHNLNFGSQVFHAIFQWED